MHLRWLWMQRLVFASLAVAVAACSGQATQARQGHRATTARPKIAYANIGGYLLGFEWAGKGGLAVILGGGDTASGGSTHGPGGLPPAGTAPPGVCHRSWRGGR